ncbi:TetR/AcrR family transcriptional regulator [Variovorax sp.]|uniref:TetR/AcrR family transcriptional regulator n=1 Tax=Variovorax sp. TaxID=1871043 RepID=UPI0013802A35|nr:TetR/AcrR family transcriptional regulator [Variovorax sp.]KAF1065698.1 MAG: HTH-type transcriptional repressor NicS [Variovorax sp.]
MPATPKASTAETPAPKAPRTPRKTDGREAILRAAERLFAEHGFEGCSLRAVADLAKVNQGMIHYFFKSKDALFLETYMRGGQPLVDERMRLLDAEEALQDGRPIGLERLIEIFLTPAVALALSGARGRNFLRMQAHLQLDGTRFGSKLRSSLYDDSSRRLVRAFARSLPGLSQEQVAWRFIFVLGTYQYVLADTGRLEVISDGASNGREFDKALREMIPFLAAGMRAAGPA